jgi:hypothetical protein
MNFAALFMWRYPLFSGVASMYGMLEVKYLQLEAGIMVNIKVLLLRLQR